MIVELRVDPITPVSHMYSGRELCAVIYVSD